MIVKLPSIFPFIARLPSGDGAGLPRLHSPSRVQSARATSLLNCPAAAPERVHWLESALSKLAWHGPRLERGAIGMPHLSSGKPAILPRGSLCRLLDLTQAPRWRAKSCNQSEAARMPRISRDRPRFKMASTICASPGPEFSEETATGGRDQEAMRMWLGKCSSRDAVTLPLEVNFCNMRPDPRLMEAAQIEVDTLERDNLITSCRVSIVAPETGSRLSADNIRIVVLAGPRMLCAEGDSRWFRCLRHPWPEKVEPDARPDRASSSVR